MSKQSSHVRLRQAPRLRALSRRVIWFEPPAKALADPDRFLCYLMARATPEDVAIAGEYFDRADFLSALRHAPPGLFTSRAWAYWNLVLEGHNERPLPRRFEHMPTLHPWG